MKSENYRQLLNHEFEAKEMTKEDFDNTLVHFAKLYHKEQLALLRVVGRSEQLPCDCQKYPTYFGEDGKPRCKNCNKRSWLAR